MTTAFDSWLAKELVAGLADIKFAIVPGKGVSVQAIQNEVVAAELALTQGYTRPLPKATSILPKQISEFIAKH